MLAGAWAAGLVAVVGIGIAGPAAPARADTAVVPAPSAAAITLLAPALVPLTESRLTMTVPPARGVLISATSVDVAGTVAGDGSVVVTLESRRQHLLESRTIPVTNGHFATSFALPNPRPGGRMWVSIALVSPEGLPIEAIRRPFVSGPLVRRPLGDDGLLGGIVLGGSSPDAVAQD